MPFPAPLDKLPPAILDSAVVPAHSVRAAAEQRYGQQSREGGGHLTLSCFGPGFGLTFLLPTVTFLA